MEKLDRFEKKEEKSEEKSKYAEFVEKNKNKLIILFGQPFVGKTTFAHVLTRFFTRTVYLKIDKNFSVEMYSKIAKNIDYIEIRSPAHLLSELKELRMKRLADNTFVVVDSLTSLDAFFVPDDPTKQSPLTDKLRARFADATLQMLSQLKSNATVLCIAHERIRDFQTQEIVPRFNAVALRHADVIYRLVVEDGTRKVKKVAERMVVELPEFQF